MAKHKKPDYMRVGGKSRKQIAQYLLNVGCGYGQLFAFDCDNSSADFAFNHLLKIHQEGGYGGLESRDPVWILACKRKYAEEYCRWRPGNEDDETEEPDIDWDSTHEMENYTLYEYGVEDTARSFISYSRRTGHGKPDDDCWNTLWDGSSVDVQFEFQDGSRNDDVLALVKFEGHDCSNKEALADMLRLDSGELTPEEAKETRLLHDTAEPLRWSVMKKLYEYVQTLEHFFKNGSYYKEIEYQAAFSFFENICDGLPNPTADAAAEERRRAREIEFLDSLGRGGRGGRLTEPMVKIKGRMTAARPPRMVTFLPEMT